MGLQIRGYDVHRPQGDFLVVVIQSSQHALEEAAAIFNVVHSFKHTFSRGKSQCPVRMLWPLVAQEEGIGVW